MPDAPREVELKLRIDAGAVAQLMRHPALAEVKQARARRAQLKSVYFDTPDGRLAGEGVALRVRRAGARWLQAIKGPASASSGGGLSERVECEWALARSERRPPLDIDKLASTPYHRMIEKAMRRAPLAPVFVTEFERMTIPLRFADRTTATLCLDRGFVQAGERPTRRSPREPIHEIELELASGNAARLFDLALTLSRDLPIALETRSKAERGYDLVAQKRAAPVHAAPVAYPRDATAGDALAAIFRNCLRQIEGNADGVLAYDDPEWVHQMRVGVRRLRSALALARKALPAGSLGTLAIELCWLARTLGDARDLDVFATETLPAIASATDVLANSEASIADARRGLARRAKREARRARNRARTAVASPRFAQILLAGGRLAADATSRSTSDSDPLAVPAEAFAAAHLKRRLRRVMRADEALEGSTEAWHALRIDAKKLRYAAEFFAPLYPAKRARSFTKPLARLQEALGRANDATVALTLAARLSASDAPAAGLVTGWAAAQADAHAKALARARDRIRDARPFWTGA